MIEYDEMNQTARECADWIMEQLGPEVLTVDAFLEFTNGSGMAPYDWDVDTWVAEFFEWRFSPAWQRIVWEAWDACGRPATEEFYDLYGDEGDPENRREAQAVGRVLAIQDMVGRFMAGAFARACLAADWVAVPVDMGGPSDLEDATGDVWRPSGDASELPSGAWLIDGCAWDWNEGGDAVEVYPCGLAYRLGVAMPPAVA
nr:MAG TPA: hypothetical protein [Caudoviricetes sp.]